jgi:multidrug transporter EmrE-like cation transporter
LKTAEFQLAFTATLIAFVLQQLAFSRGRVSVVIPVGGAAGTLLTALLGFGLLHEPLNALRVGGIATVVAGTLLATMPGAAPPGLARAPANVL